MDTAGRVSWWRVLRNEKQSESEWKEGAPERQMSGGSIDCRRSWSLSWWDLSVSPRSGSVPLFTPPPHLCRRIFFHRVSMQRWAVSALVLPYCKWSRPCRISINHQRVVGLRAPAAQNELSVAVVNGKGHLSSKAVPARSEDGGRLRGEGQINLRDRGGCMLLHCNQPAFFFYSRVEKS